MPVTFPTRDNQPELPADWHEPEVDALIEGAVDLHVHPFPSPFPRRMGILEAARDAANAKYRAIIVKSHHHSMVPEVLALEEAGLNEIPVKVFGGIALNPQVGGLNPYAVDLALNLGGKIVWFPTISSPAHLDHEHAGGGFPNSTITLRHVPAVSIFDEDGAVKPEVFDILEQIRDHGAILTGGHLPASQIDTLITEAQKIGVERIVVNHPNFIIGASFEIVHEWAKKGVFIEHAFGMYETIIGVRKNPFEFSVLQRYIAEAGVGQTIIVSDSGQKGNPRPVDIIKSAIKALLDHDYDEKSIRSMTGDNAAQILLG
jgi:hypothetical protein